MTTGRVEKPRVLPTAPQAAQVSGRIKGYFEKKVTAWKGDAAKKLGKDPATVTKKEVAKEAASSVISSLRELPHDAREKLAPAYNRLAATALGRKIGELKKSLSEKIRAKNKEVGFTEHGHQIGRSLSQLKETIGSRLHFRRAVAREEQDGDAAEGDTRVRLGKPGGAPVRHEVSREHTVRGVKYGSEKGVPVKTASATKRSLEKRIASLNAKIQGGQPPAGKTLEGLKREKAAAEKALKDIPDGASEFVASGDARAAFKEGRDVFPSQLVNAYRQTVLGADGKQLGTVFRSGAITDWRHGLTSLRELQEARDNARQELRDRPAGSEAEATRPVPSSVRTRLDALREKKGRGSKFQQVLESLHLRSHKFIPHAQLRAIEGTRNLFRDPETAVAERECSLQQQMLGLLESQLKEHAAQLKNGQPLVLGHVSVLNPSKKALEKTGFARMEENEMLDTHDAFKMFDGKEIKFDGEEGDAPYIDADGAVHMARPEGLPEGVSSITTRTCFFNVAVQAYKREDLGVQKEIDAASFARLDPIIEEKCKAVDKEIEAAQKAIDDSKGKPATEQLPFYRKIRELEEKKKQMRALLTTCKEKIAKGESSYKIAEDMTRLFTLADIPVSVNCMSGKDRTGYVASRTMAQCMQSHVQETLGAQDPEKAAMVQEELGARGFDPDSVSAQIVEVNTGSRWMKVAPTAKTPGVTTVVGVAQRVIGTIGAVVAKAPD